jgi:hypothetical protein
MRVLQIRSILFFLHIVFLLLAATSFSVVTIFGESWSFDCEFWKLSYSRGWGHRYVSEYSIWRVLCYLIGYGLGIPVYAYVARAGWAWLATLGVILCGIGVISFVIEGSHWVVSHNLSLIASFPAAMPALWILWLYKVSRFKPPSH